MTDRKYFYTEPLAAAWMHRQFRMRHGFHDERGDFREYEVPLSGQDDRWRSDGGRFYVHPDSRSLLEPREGDGVEFDRWFWERQRDDSLKDTPYQPHLGRVLLFKNKRPDGGDWMQISSAGIGWDDNYGGRFALPFKIIQRNGTPYFWPESEAA